MLLDLNLLDLNPAKVVAEVRRHALLLRADPAGYLVRVERGARLRLCQRLYLDLDRDPANTVLVAGSGRSGTTWLGDVINYDDSYRVIFEPFNPLRVAAWSSFQHRLFLRPDNRDPHVYEAVRSILSGAIRNAWADSHNRRLWARRRVVKEISINNMLGYVSRRLPEVRLIYILRHPFSVAQSRLRLGWDVYPDPTVRTDLSLFTCQADLMEDYLEPFRGILERPLSRFAAEVAFWAAENYAPLQQLAKAPGAKIVFYEPLIARSRESIAAVFEHVGRQYDAQVEKIALRPSGTSGRKSVVKDRERELLAGWKKECSPEDIRDGMAVLEAFHLDNVYNDKPLPVSYQ